MRVHRFQLITHSDHFKVMLPQAINWQVDLSLKFYWEISLDKILLHQLKKNPGIKTTIGR